jgi:hypothetical protein
MNRPSTFSHICLLIISNKDRLLLLLAPNSFKMCSSNYIYIKLKQICSKIISTYELVRTDKTPSGSDMEDEPSPNYKLSFSFHLSVTNNNQKLPWLSISDYDGAGKALSAMCEIASEACSAWFPQSDN